MRLTCAVPYLATSASRPSTIAGRALSASIRTASLSVTSLAMAVPRPGRDGRMVTRPLVATASRGAGSGGSAFGESAVAAQALVAFLEQCVGAQRFQGVELVEQHGLEADRHRLGV